jgi:hypothetical protein
LTNVIFADGVTSILPGLLYKSTSIINVTIPSSITNIPSNPPMGAGPFSACVQLLAIIVAPQNLYYSSMQGVLFDVKQTTLIAYPNGLIGNYTIPESVTSISDYAFKFSGNLTSVTLPSGLTNIGDYAFQSCPSLTNVFSAGNAPTADTTVFSGDTNATAYYLPGTTGWSNTFAGIPTALWTLPYPLILNNGFGLETNGFGFTVSWATNRTVVVEACTNLANPVWQPLQTNTLTATTNGGFFNFTDSQWTNYPGRFYRVQAQ